MGADTMPKFVAEFVNPAKRSLWGKECLMAHANEKASAKHAGVGEGGGWGEGDLRAKRARKRKPSCFPPTLPNRYRLTFYIFATATRGRVSFEFHQVALRYHWILHLFQLHFQLFMHCRWSREVWDHSRSRSTGTIQCFLCRLSCETCKSTLPHIFYLNRTFVIYIFSTLEQLVCPF